jgi:hypothetical protein
VRLDIDRLETRALLTGAPAFAEFQGAIPGQGAGAIAAEVRPDDFGFAAGGRVILRIDAQAAPGSLLDPGATAVWSAGRGGARVLPQRPGDRPNVSLASVAPGALRMQPTARGGTAGDYVLNVSLAGDVDGDFDVDGLDLRAIRLAFGRVQGLGDAPPLVADVNGDGRVGMLDWTLAFRNLGAATNLRPLEASLGLDPSADPDGDGAVDADTTQVDVVGVSAPGALVGLDIGDDGTIEATTTANSDGSYRFTVPLNPGANPIAVQASDGFGQVVTTRIDVTRGAATQPISESYDFAQGDHGWRSGFADLPIDANESYELDSGLKPLPSELGVEGTGYLLQSHNRSDDVFMFLTKQLGAEDGIVANQTYQVQFTIKFASNAPSNAVGVGGAPGESVVLKAGASSVEPRAVEEDGYYRMNVDKGNNSEGGPAASVAGNIANGLEQDGDEPVPYVSLTVEHTHTVDVQADADGNLWLLVGTDSGFEGLTALYYQQIDVQLTPVVA